MKKLFCLLLAALLIGTLFAGCDLQNRKPSSDFIPETVPTESTEPPTYETEPLEPSTAAVMEVTVRDLVVEDGSYTDRYGNTYNYKYHVPYIDAEARYAQGCNKEIDRLFGAEVTAQRNAMQDGSTLTVLSVDYMTRLRGEFLTVYITMKDVEGEQTRAVYTLNRRTGDEIKGEMILDYLGLDEESFQSLAMNAAGVAFEEAYGEYAWSDQIRYNSARDRSLREENYTAEMPMYIDESDRLTILATLYDLAGAAHTEPIVVEYEPATTEP